MGGGGERHILLGFVFWYFKGGLKMIILGFSEEHTQKRPFVLLFKTKSGNFQVFCNLKEREKKKSLLMSPRS
jgi:hypothetical protein